MFLSIRHLLAALFDRLAECSKKEWFERGVVIAATGGFLMHLLLIAAVRNLPDMPQTILEGVDRSPLHAVYTPFSIILFYEVILLVFAIANSHTGEIAKQYQIMSLIIVRRVFKDIGGFENIDNWLAEPEAALAVLLDMGGAVAMFVIVTGFTLIRQKTPKISIERNLDGFIDLKKAVAVLLLFVMVGLAALNFARWLRIVPATVIGQPHPPQNLDLFFFPLFFEFMIFADVFLLIVSLAYYDRYEYVFRNAGFVISTVLLRVSLSTPKPYDLGVALVAMVYGIVVLGVFSWFSSIVRPEQERLEGTALPAVREKDSHREIPESR